MPAAESAVLKLAGALDAAGVARQARLLDGALRGIDVIDLGAVAELDSAGVAFVRSLRSRAASLNGQAPRLSAVPERFRQLCVAHRVDCDGD